MNVQVVSEAELFLLNWLSNIDAEDFHRVNVKIQAGEVVLNCFSAYLAFEYWKRRHELRCHTPLDLTIKLNGTFFDSTLRAKSMISSWLSANLTTFRALQNAYTASIHAEQPALPYIAVQPLYGIEAVLNKPIRDLLGNPLEIVTSEIAEAKRSAIQRAISSGGTASETYSHSWKGGIWKKECTAVYLPGHSEVLVQVKPLRGEEWHYGFWRNWQQPT